MELLQPGVLAVLVISQRLSVAGSVGAKGTLMDRGLSVTSGVFGCHVTAKFVFSLAGERTDFTNERLGLVS